MFQFKRDDEGMTIRVTGSTVEQINEIANTLELNVKWPIIPLALDCLGQISKLHNETEEKLRDVVMLDDSESEGVFLFDIEAMKVLGKKMEIQGLGPDKEDI